MPVMCIHTGPSDRVRTCGLMVPNHPRYQLRHTRKYLIRIFRKHTCFEIIAENERFVKPFGVMRKMKS